MCGVIAPRWGAPPGQDPSHWWRRPWRHRCPAPIAGRPASPSVRSGGGPRVERQGIGQPSFLPSFHFLLKPSNRVATTPQRHKPHSMRVSAWRQKCCGGKRNATPRRSVRMWRFMFRTFWKYRHALALCPCRLWRCGGCGGIFQGFCKNKGSWAVKPRVCQI